MQKKVRLRASGKECEGNAFWGCCPFGMSVRTRNSKTITAIYIMFYTGERGYVIYDCLVNIAMILT